MLCAGWERLNNTRPLVNFMWDHVLVLKCDLDVFCSIILYNILHFNTNILLIYFSFNIFFFIFINITEVMAKLLAGQTAVLPDCRFSVQCKVIALLAFYDAITGPTEFIISVVNSLKMVNMP